MPVGEFCTRDVVIADRGADLIDVARLMREHHVGSVVIVDRNAQKNMPIGIVTDRDLVIEVLSQGLPLDAVSVGDIMSDILVTVREQDGLWESIRQMRERSVRRVPVVDADGALVGLLAADDVLELLSEEFAHLMSIVGAEMRKEAKSRQ